LNLLFRPDLNLSIKQRGTQTRRGFKKNKQAHSQITDRDRVVVVVVMKNIKKLNLLVSAD